MSTDKFLTGLRHWSMDLPEDPEKWTFGGLKRRDDGMFPDAELVRLLEAGTENVAGKYYHNGLCCPPTSYIYLPVSLSFLGAFGVQKYPRCP